MSEVIETQQAMEERRFAYDLLRRSFREEPSLPYLEVMTKEDLIESFPFVKENSSINEGVELIKSYVSQHDVLDKKIYEQLHWDYTRMFIGPYTLPAPLWESAYVSEERLLFQEDTLKVRREYFKYNFLPKNYGHEAEDHLGLELDFMFQLNELCITYLGGQDIAALQSVLEDQAAFLSRHLQSFVPRIVLNILNSAETDFYRGLAKILEGFLETDTDLLKELLAELQ